MKKTLLVSIISIFLLTFLIASCPPPGCHYGNDCTTWHLSGAVTVGNGTIHITGTAIAGDMPVGSAQTARFIAISDGVFTCITCGKDDTTWTGTTIEDVLFPPGTTTINLTFLANTSITHTVTLFLAQSSCANCAIVVVLKTDPYGTTPTPTNTATPTKTYTPTPTKTPTITKTPTSAYTHTPTETFTLTPTETFTSTPTSTYTHSPTETFTLTPTETFTLTPTETFTLIPTDTFTLTPTKTFTLTPTETYTYTPTNTPVTPTDTYTPTNTPVTPTDTYTPAYTYTPTVSETFTPTYTYTPTITGTFIPTVTGTKFPPTETYTPGMTPTGTLPTWTPTITQPPYIPPHPIWLQLWICDTSEPVCFNHNIKPGPDGGCFIYDLDGTIIPTSAVYTYCFVDPKYLGSFKLVYSGWITLPTPGAGQCWDVDCAGDVLLAKINKTMGWHLKYLWFFPGYGGH